MGYLIAAAAAPVVGPVLYRLLHERPDAVRLVDGFVYVAVPTLVAWQVLPGAWEQRSPLPVAVVAAGLIVPVAMEKASRALARRTDDLALVVGLSGLVLHAFLEGAALAPRGDAVALPFALAVIVHRIPVGLVIWWLLRPRYGLSMAAAAVGALVLATFGGFGLSGELLGGTPGPAVELYEAFVSGSLVHVVFHQGRHDHQHGEHGHGHH